MSKLMRQLMPLSLLMSIAGAVGGQTRVEIPRVEVAEHRISRENWIRAPGAALFQGLNLRIEVDRSGIVTSVRVTEGPEEFHKDAIALVKNWRYQPFERNGQTVPATFIDFVLILPPELPIISNVPFPAVRNWASVRITLERTRCLGSCPAYEVQIGGDGDVVFNGRYPVEGQRRRHISRQAVQDLLDVFRKANYFSLNRDYSVKATDLPGCFTSISIDGQSMSVYDYAGLSVGMPGSVRAVEEAIDQAAGTREWLKPDH